MRNVDDFSIDMEIEKIFDLRSREYFSEVVSSYDAGNFRSAIVMLWSVIICDLLFKLDHLVNFFSDQAAKKILSDVEVERQKKPNSPEWEILLLNKILDKTSLLDKIEYADLVNIQKLRHLSAHPIITNKEVLFSPTEEMVKAYIRSALESVLVKPPVMSKKIFDALVEDLERNAALLPDQVSLERYLKAKYFPHLVPAIENEVFKSMWRLVFKVSDQRSEQNREINCRTLMILCERRQKDLEEMIESEKTYFSDVLFSGSHLAQLIVFLNANPKVFNRLDDAARVPLRNYVGNDSNRLIDAWFVSDGADEHLKKIEASVSTCTYLNAMTPEKYKILCDHTKGTQFFKRVLRIGIELYGKSGSFDTADNRFEGMIYPNISFYEKDDFEVLLAKIEPNNQIYGRGRSRRDHEHLVEPLTRILGADYNQTNYPKFFLSLQ